MGRFWSAGGSTTGSPAGRHERLVDGVLRVVAEYDAGRRRMDRVERYESGALRSRASWLGPLTRVSEPDDPWRVRVAVLGRPPAKRSATAGVRSWWPNGQRKLVAEYRYGEGDRRCALVARKRPVGPSRPLRAGASRWAIGRGGERMAGAKRAGATSRAESRSARLAVVTVRPMKTSLR